MTIPTHMWEAISHPVSRPVRTNRLASLAATGTFLDHLPCTSRETLEWSARPQASDIGITFQLLTLRTIDGARALEPKLDIPVPPGTDPAERFLLSGSRLLDATREIIVQTAPDGHAHEREVFVGADSPAARVEITELVSLQRFWGAAANGLMPGDRTACRIRPGVVLLGALLVRAASLGALATLFWALDKASAHGMPSTAHSRGACQLDVLAVAGGGNGELPDLASIIHSQESGCPARDVAAHAGRSWAWAPYRLEGRDARRATSQLARMSPLSFFADPQA